MVLGIFFGEVASVRFASGFHHLPSANGAKILKIETPPNAFGVYSAKVEINGVTKNGISTFFPDHWSREKIADVINTVRLSGVADPLDSRVLRKKIEGVNVKVVFNNLKDKIVTTAYPELP